MRIILITPFLFPDSEVGGNRWTKFIRRDTKNEYIIIKTKSISNSANLENIGGKKNILKTIFLSHNITAFICAHLDRFVTILFYSLPRRVFKDKQIQLKRISQTVSQFLFRPDQHYVIAKAVYGKILNENRSIFETADIIIGSHPHSSSLYLASKLSKDLRKPWVADMRDPWSQDHQNYGASCFKVPEFEKELLDKASAVLAINSSIPLGTNRRVDIIPNNYTPLELEGSSTDGDQIRLLYTGTVQPGLLTEYFQEACARDDLKKKNKVKVQYCGRNFSEFCPPENHCQIRFIDSGYLSKSALDEEMRKADIFILFGWKGANAKCVMTGKLFDYLQYEKPIMCFAQKDTELYEFMKKSNAGPVFSSTGEFIPFLEEILGSKSFKLDVVKRYSPNQNYLINFQTGECLRKLNGILQELVSNYPQTSIQD